MRRLASPLLAALLLAPPALAAAPRTAGVEVVGPWSRPAAAGMNGVGYLTLVNRGARPVRLIGATTPAARAVSLHETRVTDGVMTMRPVSDGLAVPAGGATALAPGGYHLMLLGLTQTTTAGGKIPLTLIFAGGQRVTTVLNVQAGVPAPPAGPAAAPEHHHP